MNKFPLTPAGVQDLTTELYLLSDTDLNTEALALSVNLRSWVRVHFDLTTSQDLYLTNLPANFVTFTSIRSSFALSHRLPINFIIPIAALGNEDPDNKRIKSLDKITQSTDETENEGLGGSFDIEVTYA